MHICSFPMSFEFDIIKPMTYDEEFSAMTDASQLVRRTLEGISKEGYRNASRTEEAWKRTLEGINNPANPYEGKNLFSHSHINDLKNGILFIDVDHPGWINLFQLRKKFILNGMKRYAPELGITSIAFRVGGKRGNITGAEYSKEEVKRSVEENIRKEDELLSKVQGVASSAPPKKEEMPKELAALFSDMEKHIGD